MCSSLTRDVHSVDFPYEANWSTTSLSQHIEKIGVSKGIHVAAVKEGYLNRFWTATNSRERRVVNSLDRKTCSLFARVLPVYYRNLTEELPEPEATDGADGQRYEPGNADGPAAPRNSGRALLAHDRSWRPSRLLPRSTRRL